MTPNRGLAGHIEISSTYQLTARTVGTKSNQKISILLTGRRKRIWLDHFEHARCTPVLEF